MACVVVLDKRVGAGTTDTDPEAAPMRKTTRQIERDIARVLSLSRSSHVSRRRPRLSHSAQPANWWRKATPEEERVCYDTKTKALKAFLDANSEIVQSYGGADYAVSPSEFDAVNHKHSLHGKRAARTIAQAVWAAMPEGKPYCLDRIDIDALNDTSPARESHLAFRLPDYIYEDAIAKEEERYYRSLSHLARMRTCRRCGRPLM